MNKELKDRVFTIPDNILNNINKTILSLNDDNVRGIERAKKLLSDKKVKYGQLKRILHDLTYIDKDKEKIKYDLAGGDDMLNWAKSHLKNERDLISNRKDSKKQADDISSITGFRKNSHLKKHKKRFNFKIPTNLIKSNSHKSSISPITSLGLFEEINKIKKLINY
jgi:hypothetical protein